MVLKNVFNSKAEIEEFSIQDIELNLGIDRNNLIQLAHLLGSDYTKGISGVGVVFGVELLSEFLGNFF